MNSSDRCIVSALRSIAGMALDLSEKLDRSRAAIDRLKSALSSVAQATIEQSVQRIATSALEDVRRSDV